MTGIEEYARNYEKVSDALADKLATKALELDRAAPRSRKNIHAAQGGTVTKTAARFLQVENRCP